MHRIQEKISFFSEVSKHYLKFVYVRKFGSSLPLRGASEKDIPLKANPEFSHLKENSEDTWIGPPHPVSNLRLKIFSKSDKLSNEEKYFLLKSEETQEWNQQYWLAHNTDFQKSRKCYIDKISVQKNLPKDEPLSPEEMSVFYKEFLNRNRMKHITYNWNWYRKNIYLVLLAAKVNLLKFRKKLKNWV